MGKGSKKKVHRPLDVVHPWTQNITARLEEHWLPRLRARWRAQTSSRATGPLSEAEIERVAQGVERLSAGLTRDRALVSGGYMQDPELLGAYLLFYWPVSYVQARHVLRHVSALGDSLDLGCGPGPVCAALLDHGAGQVHGVDHASKALKVACELLPSLNTLKLNLGATPQLSAHIPSIQTITFGHALNELIRAPEDVPKISQWLNTQAQELGASNVVIMEPALRETSRQVLQVRDLLLEQGWAVHAPCLHQAACPALVHKDDWCHASLTWSLPEDMEKVAQRARVHKSRLKMTYMVLSRQPAQPAPDDAWRVVSDSLHAKGVFRVIGCGPQGRSHLVLQAKHDVGALEAFKDLRRYDVLRASPLEVRGDGLRLNLDTSFERVAYTFEEDASEGGVLDAQGET